MCPINVNKGNEDKVFKNLYGDSKDIIKNLTAIHIRLKVGDLVRISKVKNIFEKGYVTNWSDEIFIVSEVIIREIPVYRIRDRKGEEIKGVFYDYELQKVFKLDQTIHIEKIIKSRKSKKNGTEYLVKWLNQSSKFNSWVKASDLQ